MEFKLDFDPAEMAKKMADTIANSAFKEMFEKAVKDEISRINNGSWQSESVVQGVIQNFIRERMREILETEYKQLVDEAIKKAMVGEKLNSLVEKFVERIDLRNY